MSRNLALLALIGSGSLCYSSEHNTGRLAYPQKTDKVLHSYTEKFTFGSVMINRDHRECISPEGGLVQEDTYSYLNTSGPRVNWHTDTTQKTFEAIKAACLAAKAQQPEEEQKGK